MPTKQLTVRVGQSVIDDINYLSYVMRAHSQAEVISTVMQLVADAVRAASDADDALGKGGTILTREEQAAWSTLVRELRQRAAGQ
jgi:hypothetical protein